jgi:NADH pyrophosphatase NudC (nudix superfamily)
MYDQCVLREAKEEIGIDLFETPERIFKIDACEETANEFTWVYRTLNDGPFSVNQQEISEIRWFTKEDVGRLIDSKREIFSPAFALVWGMMQEGGFLEVD